MGPDAGKEVTVLERPPYEEVLEQMRQEIDEKIGNNEISKDELDGLREVVDRFTKVSELEDPRTQQFFTADQGLASDAVLLREDPLKLADSLEKEAVLKRQRGQFTPGLSGSIIAALDEFRKLYAERVPQTLDRANTKMPVGSR